MNSRPILPLIVGAQFCCTSVWFASNAVMPALVRELRLPPHYPALLSSAVQAGFIAGTFVFALLSLADRYAPSQVFRISAVLAAAANLAIAVPAGSHAGVLAARVLTGFFLAGIYPVGMKIAADHFGDRLGKSLGYLVGALVLGTALPHLLRSLTIGLPWKRVIAATSGLCLLGGAAVGMLVPDGPYRRAAVRGSFGAALKAFRMKEFRSSAFGYFGHMWELYAFWAFVPVMLAGWLEQHRSAQLNVPLVAFFVIASGGPACVGCGLLAQRFGAKLVAAAALSVSGICCLLSPVFLGLGSTVLLILFLLIWGMAVVADSPLFTSLVAWEAPPEARGAVLTMVTCIGFSITIVSIQLIHASFECLGARQVYVLLAVGPALGLLALFRKRGPS